MKKIIRKYKIKAWADLSEADLRGACLIGACLIGANLRGANLRGANLIEADLRGANLRGANLRETDLRGTYLIGANLTSAKCVLPLPIAEPRIYRHVAVWHGDHWRIFAGCRSFTVDEARKHWLSVDYDGPASVRNTYPAALGWLEKQECPT